MDRDNEAITGQAAFEFSAEATLHLERYRYLASYISRLIRRYRVRHVMDFGCGPAILTSMIAALNPEVKLTAIDLSADMLTQARKNITGHQIQLVHYNIKQVNGNAPELSDLVISRNMLHRVENLEQSLLAMARGCKPKGGMVFTTSFRNFSDLDEAGRHRWLVDYRARDSWPALQMAWLKAYFNAPRLLQYQTTARRIAYLIDAEDLRVTAGRHNEVNIFLKKRS